MSAFNLGKISGMLLMAFVVCGDRALAGTSAVARPRWVDGVIAAVAFVLYVAAEWRGRRRA